MKLVPPRIALVFTVLACGAVAHAVVSSSVLEQSRIGAAAVADGWRELTALERTRGVLLAADAACGRAGGWARCAGLDDALEGAIAELAPVGSGDAGRGPGLARLEAALRAYVAAAVRGRTSAGGRALRREADAALAAVEGEAARALADRERASERSASRARIVVLATELALLALVAIAVLAVRRHLRERTRRDLEHARVLHLQQQLLGIVGHDLRTPLSAIAGSAALLARAPDLPSSRVPLAQRIVSSAGRMSRLVRDLLDFTRVRTEGGLPVSPEPVNLGTLCRRVALEVKAARPETILDCVVEGDVTGEWDPARLEQVVSNLITNACHHGAAGRPVNVRVEGLDDAVRIAVHNEGPPIPGDALPHIFDPYWHGDRADRTGLGLGLHIVRLLVEAHGGTVEVASGEDGTTFSVMLPAPVVAHRPEPPRSTLAH